MDEIEIGNQTLRWGRGAGPCGASALALFHGLRREGEWEEE